LPSIYHMSTGIEMDDLSSRKQPVPAEDMSTPDPTTTQVTSQSASTVTVWAYGSTALLATLAIPMVFFPRVLLFTSETGPNSRTALTPLESFLALHGGILLFALAMSLLFNIPSDRPVAQMTSKVAGHPLLVPLTTASTLIAFLSYNTKSVSSLASLVFLGSATIGVWGLWTIMFSGTSNVSKKTGADKHTSRFLFGNKSAASVQKTRWKAEQAKKGD